MNIIEILSCYKIERVHDEGISTRYVFSKPKGDYLEILLFKATNDVRFIDDNYPGSRRIFATNIPYNSVKDFENDLKRMQIQIPDKCKNN